VNAVIPPLPAHAELRDFFRGLALPFQALRVMVSSAKLLGLSLLSALVTSCVLVLLAVFWWPRAFAWASALVGTGSWRDVVVFIVGFLLFALTFFVSALTVPNLVLAPLQDPLSEATEERCGDFTSVSSSVRATVRGTLHSLGHTFLRLATQLIGVAVLLPLNLIPGAGSIAFAIAGSVWSMFCLALEHLSNPMARHLYPFGQVVVVLRRRLALALGFGAALYCMLWVPVLNFFLLPIAVVAGTLLYRALRTAQVLGAPGRRVES
jgi:CysZ protein